ncbi:hypothetical protein ACFLY9_00165 [Patescibacteria group bacterium]
MESKDDIFLQNKSKKKKFSPTLPQLLVGIFLGFTIVGTLIFYISNNQKRDASLPATGEENSDKLLADEQLEDIEGSSYFEKMALVGKEYLFIKDLESYALMNLKTIEEIDREKAINDLVGQSVMLQIGESEGWIDLSSDVFNNPFKNMIERSELLVDLSEDYETKYREGIYIEILNVWFYNIEPGEYANKNGLEAAKQLANAKIQSAYNFVQNKNYTLEEAAGELLKDSEMGELNPSYETTTYFDTIYPYEINSVDDLRDGHVFGMDGLFDFLQNAEVGDVSEIYLEKDNPGGDGPVIDAYYSFYKLNSKKEGFATIDEFIEGNKDNFIIEIYLEI